MKLRQNSGDELSDVDKYLYMLEKLDSTEIIQGDKNKTEPLFRLGNFYNRE
jgi:hypothetical protein